MSAQCSAVAVATAAAAAGAVLGLGVARAFPPVASLTDAPLPCQMQLYFVAQLEPTRMRWKGDQVHTTRLKTRKQVCRSATVSSLCTIQHFPSAWAGCAPKLTVTLTVAETKSCLHTNTNTHKHTQTNNNRKHRNKPATNKQQKQQQLEQHQQQQQ